MALIICPDCGKEVSSTADSCPNCGRQSAASLTKEAQKRGRRFAATVLIILGIMVLLTIPVVNFCFGIIS